METKCSSFPITVGIAAVGNFKGAVQHLHLVEGSNTDEFFVAAQWKQYPCSMLYGYLIINCQNKNYECNSKF